METLSSSLGKHSSPKFDELAVVDAHQGCVSTLKRISQHKLGRQKSVCRQPSVEIPSSVFLGDAPSRCVFFSSLDTPKRW
jgi:hypothetical protein